MLTCWPPPPFLTFILSSFHLALKKNNITKFPNVHSRVRNSSSSSPVVVDVSQTWQASLYYLLLSFNLGSTHHRPSCLSVFSSLLLLLSKLQDLYLTPLSSFFSFLLFNEKMLLGFTRCMEGFLDFWQRLTSETPAACLACSNNQLTCRAIFF